MKLTTKFLYISLLFLFSCIRQPIEPIPQPNANIDTSYQTIGLYVLNEGLFNMNNSTLTYFDFATKTAHTDFFNTKNGRKLGDTGNDIAIYGKKMYIVVNASSQIEVLDAYTAISIKQIPIFNGNKPRQPRSIAFYKSKALVCSFDGTVAVIDTATLLVENYINVGRNPDGIAVVGNKLYVSNSGGLDFPNYDNTVSVIDLKTQTEIKRIKVQINPYTLNADKYGDLYVVSRGNYNDVPMCLQIIDTQADTLKYTFPNLEVLNFTICGDSAYLYYFDFMNGTSGKIMILDVLNETILSTNFIADGTNLSTPYGIAVDKISGDVFITNAKGFVNKGEVFCFDKQGKKKYSFQTGLNPAKMCFLYKMNIQTN